MLKKINKIKKKTKKKQTKIKEKMHQLLLRQELVVKMDIVIFLSYFVEKVFLDFMFKRI